MRVFKFWNEAGEEKCMQTYKDGDGKDVTIECCKECRCEKCK